MFSRKKKPEPKKKSKRTGSSELNFNAFGVSPSQEPDDEELEAELRALTGGGAIDMGISINDDDDSDLEAELMKLVGGHKAKIPITKAEHKIEKQLSLGTINKIAKSSVSDDEDVDVDADVDEDDPELLGELMELTTPQDYPEPEPESDSEPEETTKQEEPDLLTILKDRLEMYRTAEAKAKAGNESSRARRFTRGIKTLVELIKKAEAGQPVLPSEIPPLIATNLRPPSPKPREAVEEPVPTNKPEVINRNDPEEPVISNEPQKPVTPKRTEEPPAATRLEKKPEDTDAHMPKEKQPSRSGDTILDNAVSNLTKSVGRLRINEEVKDTKPNVKLPQKDEETVGVAPAAATEESSLVRLLKSRREEYKQSAVKAKKTNQMPLALEQVKIVKQLTALISAAEAGEKINERAIPPSLKETPVQKAVQPSVPMEAPATVMEALHQRLRIYTDMKTRAEREGNANLARQNAKIVQLYTDAIRLHKSGKALPLARLPTPPGCPPIPVPFQVP